MAVVVLETCFRVRLLEGSGAENSLVFHLDVVCIVVVSVHGTVLGEPVHFSCQIFVMFITGGKIFVELFLCCEALRHG